MRQALVLLVLAIVGCTPAQRRAFEPDNLFSYTRPADFLTHGVYKRLVIEVLSDGAPTLGDLAWLRARATAYCDKPAGVELVIEAPAPPGTILARDWTDAGLAEVESKLAQRGSQAGTLVLHITYVRGSCKDGADIGGRTYGPASIAIFPDHVAYSRASALLLHELGHCLGLVNNGSPMKHDHAAPDDSHHCNDVECAMWFVAPTGQADFCNFCRADLRAN